MPEDEVTKTNIQDVPAQMTFGADKQVAFLERQADRWQLMFKQLKDVNE